MPSSRLGRRDYVLLPQTMWAICSSLPPSAMVNGECSKVTCASGKLLPADLTLENPSTTSARFTGEHLSQVLRLQSPQMLGSEFPLAPRRPFFVGERIFSRKHPSKSRLPLHFGPEQTQTAFILFSMWAIQSARISKHCITPRNLYSEKYLGSRLKQESYLLWGRFLTGVNQLAPRLS